MDAYDQQNTSDSANYDVDTSSAEEDKPPAKQGSTSSEHSANVEEFVLVQQDRRRKAGSVKVPKLEPRLTTKLEEPFTGNIAKITMTFNNIENQLSNPDVRFEFDILNDTAEGVAQEMVSYLSLNSSYVKLIREKLIQAVQLFKTKKQMYALEQERLAQEKAEREKAAQEREYLNNEFDDLMDGFGLFMNKMRAVGLTSVEEVADKLELRVFEDKKVVKRKDILDALNAL